MHAKKLDIDGEILPATHKNIFSDSVNSLRASSGHSPFFSRLTRSRRRGGLGFTLAAPRLRLRVKRVPHWLCDYLACGYGLNEYLTGCVITSPAAGGNRKICI